MAFENVTFPDDVSYGSVGGPGFDTAILETDGGIGEAISRRNQQRNSFNAKYGVKTIQQLSEVINFFIAMRGSATSFKFKDWTDYATTPTHVTHEGSAVTDTDVIIAAGDGVTVSFQLVKKYSKGTITRTRNIYHPDTSTVVIALDGTPLASSNFSVSGITGIVTFNSAPGVGVVITAGFKFDIEARFEKSIDTKLPVSIDAFDMESVDDIPIIEVVSETPTNEEFYYGGASNLGSISVNTQITVSDGRVIAASPSTTGLSYILPNFTNLPPGGPYFYLFNDSVVNTIAVLDHTLTTVLAAIPVSSGITLILAVDSGGSKLWRVV